MDHDGRVHVCNVYMNVYIFLNGNSLYALHFPVLHFPVLHFQLSVSLTQVIDYDLLLFLLLSANIVRNLLQSSCRKNVPLDANS